MKTTRKQDPQKPANSGNGHPEKVSTEERRTGDSTLDSCRCKEVSEKTFPEMLKLMISDLSFWKKTKRQQ